MLKKFNLFTDHSLVTNKNHVEILIPFLGDTDKDPGHPQYGRFHRFRDIGGDFLNLIDDPLESDVFVYPRKWSPNSSDFMNFLLEAKRFGKKVLVFFNDDSDCDMGLESEDVIVFRTSFYKSKQKKNEISFPGWSPDYGVGPIREKTSMPVVGFCGCANNNLARFQALTEIHQSDKISDNFILYDRFWAGWGAGIAESTDYGYAKTARDNFRKNMRNSDYILCCRGAGNFSYRLYESLSAGRIPIIIDTDIVLPHEELIPWKDISIWIKSETDSVVNSILAEHQKIAAEQFIEKQQLCRKVYENFIRPAEFFKVWLKANLGNTND